jgi:arylsulfatase A-like enzyme
MTVALLLAACASPPAVAPEARPWAVRLPDRPMTLSVTDIAPGGTAGYRIVGGFENTLVTVYRGKPGQQTCPPLLNGACLDLGKAKVVASGTTAADGSLLVQSVTPAGAPVGAMFGYQATTTDPANGDVYLSNAVERITVAALDPPPGGNVLLLLADDLGVDRIGLYGATDPPLTPRLDALAAEGILFENAWAMPWCSPTRATLQTGRLPRRTGFGEVPLILQGAVDLDPNLTTIAEVMDLSPSFTYGSSYVGKWHVSAYDSTSGTFGPIVQGWDWWVGTMANIKVWKGADPVDPVTYFHWQKIDELGVRTTETTYATTDQVDDALDRIAAMPEPWLLQVSFSAAHSPYHAPPADLHSDPTLTDASAPEDLHKAMMESIDTELGRLLDGIDPAVLDRTTVWFLGDNGTPLEVMDAAHQATGRGKATLFDGGVRVPYIVSGPLVGVPGSTSDTLVSVVDVLPTLAAIAGVDTAILRGSLDPETPAVLDGVSILPTIADPLVPADREFLYAEMFSPGGSGPFLQDDRAIRDDQYKLVVDALCGGEEFFEYVAGAEDEGPDLIAAGPLTPEQQAGLDHLRTELDAMVAAMTYDSATWPPSTAPDPPVCP